MPIVDAQTGNLYDISTKQGRDDQILQVITDALYTPVGDLKYRPNVGSIIPNIQQVYGHPRRHVAEIASSIAAAMEGYIPVETVVLRETADGLFVDVYDRTFRIQ